jgi:hypothetical protein
MSGDIFTPRNITVTKMQAARNQLDTAIELWFKGGDPRARLRCA